MQKPAGLIPWLQVYRLYLQAFPPSERKPFSLIWRMSRCGKTDVWCVKYQNRFAGFATTINGDNLILLDYFAVTKVFRGAGIGSAALKEILNRYTGKGMFVEIESPYEDGKDQEARLRRKTFYQACGMEPLHVLATVFGVKMELLGRGCSMDFAKYQRFYHENYSPWAAKNLLEEPYPEA